MRRMLLIICKLLLLALGGVTIEEVHANEMQCDTINGISNVYDINKLKEIGDSAYVKGDYTIAIKNYETILTKGEAAEVYYNLGNSYYKSGDIARAILNYERALLLEPSNGDIRANLKIAQSKTIDKVNSIPEIFLVTWYKAILYSLSMKAWAILGIVSFILFLLVLCILFFLKRRLWDRIGCGIGIVLFLLVILSNIFAFQQKNILNNRMQAIIMSPSIVVRSTPSDSGTSLFVLHAGHKVDIKDNSMREWKEIRIEDGKVGWVPVSSIEVI